MSKKIRSAKGTMVDFDLLAIKQQMASQPAPVNVEAREKFIDRKLRRRKAKNVKNDVETDVKVKAKTNIKSDDESENDEIQKQYEDALTTKNDSTDDEAEVKKDTTSAKKIKK